MIKSDLVTLDVADYSPAHKGFKPMVREQAFDVSEMAIVTYLMAKSFGKPMVLLPCVVMARSQHAFALYNARAGTLTPAGLNNKRVGIRSFTTSPYVFTSFKNARLRSTYSLRSFMVIGVLCPVIIMSALFLSVSYAF